MAAGGNAGEHPQSHWKSEWKHWGCHQLCVSIMKSTECEDGKAEPFRIMMGAGYNNREKKRLRESDWEDAFVCEIKHVVYMMLVWFSDTLLLNKKST